MLCVVRTPRLPQVPGGARLVAVPSVSAVSAVSAVRDGQRETCATLLKSLRPDSSPPKYEGGTYLITNVRTVYLQDKIVPGMKQRDKLYGSQCFSQRMPNNTITITPLPGTCNAGYLVDIKINKVVHDNGQGWHLVLSQPLVTKHVRVSGNEQSDHIRESATGTISFICNSDSSTSTSSSSGAADDIRLASLQWTTTHHIQEQFRDYDPSGTTVTQRTEVAFTEINSGTAIPLGAAARA